MPARPIPLTLAPLRKGLRIAHIQDEETHLILMRFGLGIGDIIHIFAKPPGGPLVLTRNELEIALGSQYCQRIEVEPV